MGSANALYAPQNQFATRAADSAALTQGAPVVLDLASISGGTTQKSETITDAQAVASFIVKPAAATRMFRAGVAERAFTRGDFKRHVVSGSTQVRVYNGTAASVALTVGTMLIYKPAQDYYVPCFINPTGGGTTKTLLPGGGFPAAMVRVAKTLTTLQTALVEAFVFPPTPPAPFTWTRDAVTGAVTEIPASGIVMVAPGPGMILRAGLGVVTGAGAGKLALAVKIATVNIFSAAPTIDNDCTDPCHTLVPTDTAVATYLGTGGAFGTIDQTKIFFDRNDLITYELTNTSSFVGTGVHLQVEGLLF